MARSHRSNPRAVPALMDLALPRLASPEGWSARPHLPWIVMTDPPASPVPVRLVAPLRSPSPCLYLDALSSDESAGPGDISAVPICILDASSSPVNPEQVLSDDDLLTDVRVEDRRQVIRIRDVPPEVQVVNLSQDDQICDTRLCGEKGHRRMFWAVIRSRQLTLWPCLRRARLVLYLREWVQLT